MELAASTGLRRGELFALRWRHIDFQQRLIDLADSKTDAGERQVPMFGSARKVLLEQRTSSKFKEPRHVVFSTQAGTVVDAHGWMVREFHGAMRRAACSTRIWRKPPRALTRCGVPTREQ